MEQQPDVEILVHIGAPSRAVDDARYRSLAAAYLTFESTSGSVHLFPQSEHGSSSPDRRHAQATQVSPAPVADEGDSSVMLSNEKIDFFASPQASFRSVVDNADSPHIRMGVTEMPDCIFPVQTTVSATQASWQTPPSIVQDSHPMNHTSFDSLTSPTRVLENYLQHFDSPLGSSKHDSQIDGSAVSDGRASQNAEPRLLPGSLVPCTPQMIPCTPRAINVLEPPSDRIEGLEYQHGNPQQHSEASPHVTLDDILIEETNFFSSSQPSTLTRADSEPPLKPRQPAIRGSSPRGLARAASDIGPRSSSDDKASVTITFLSSHGFTYESLEIHPPEPPASEIHIGPQELVTRGLYNLGRDVDLSSRFRPTAQTRELRPYERGHWILDCSSWEPRLKRDTWAFLANYVGTGIAGWGVWCKRDPAFRELRAYCWGSVAAHIYYVLWLSSQRKIVFTGSAWIDADGAQVIVMGSREHSQR
jgi:hypothetical protein